MDYESFLLGEQQFEIEHSPSGSVFSGRADQCVEWFLTFGGRSYCLSPILSKSEIKGRTVFKAISDLVGEIMWRADVRGALEPGRKIEMMPNAVVNAESIEDAAARFRYHIFKEVLATDEESRFSAYGDDDSAFVLRARKSITLPGAGSLGTVGTKSVGSTEGASTNNKGKAAPAAPAADLVLEKE